MMDLYEKSSSRSQQRLMGMVHKCQKTGECSSEKVKDMAEKMKNKDVEDFASTKHKSLPEKKFKEFLQIRDPLFIEQGVVDPSYAKRISSSGPTHNMEVGYDYFMNKAGADQELSRSGQMKLAVTVFNSLTKLNRYAGDKVFRVWRSWLADQAGQRQDQLQQNQVQQAKPQQVPVQP